MLIAEPSEQKDFNIQFFQILCIILENVHNKMANDKLVPCDDYVSIIHTVFAVFN